MSSERVHAPQPTERPAADEQPRPAAPTAPSLSTPAPKSYTEAQVAEILHRAAQLDHTRASQAPTLSLAEVEAIAHDAGLDPALVRLAARALDESAEPRSLGLRIAGAPLRRTIERVIDGEIGAQHHEALLADLRSAVPGSIHRPAHVSSVGRSISISSTSGPAVVELSISPREGKTLLRIDVSTSPLAGAFFGALMWAMSGGTIPLAVALAQHAHAGPAGMAVTGVAMLGGVFTFVRSLYSWRAGSVYRQFERTADALADRLSTVLSDRSS